MKHNSIELRILDCETSDSVNLGLYDEFGDYLKERIEFLLNADCDIMLRPFNWSDDHED